MLAFKPHSPARIAALLATALTLAATLATAPQAATVYGGGSPLVAPFHRQAADCYGADRPLISNTSATTLPVPPFYRCASPYISPTVNAVEYVAIDPWISVGAIYSHDPVRYGDIDDVVPGVQLWTNGVQYGLSATPLTNAEVFIYRNGGTLGGVTLSPTPTAGQSLLPGPLYGALVQFPLALFPIVLAYDPVYKKVDSGGTVTSYRFAVNPAFARASGGLRLDQATYCKIANGQITNWNDAAITVLNGGVSLKDPADPAPFSVPIELVGQLDGSDATQVVSRHFAAACASLPGNAFTNVNGAPTLPAAVQGPLLGGTPVPGLFTRAGSLDAAAAYASFSTIPGVGQTLVQGRLAYLSASYALPNAADNSMAYTLHTADLKNAAGAFRAPSPTSATAAFAANRPPQTAAGASGVYDPTQTSWGVRGNPADWVRVGDLANPTPATAYPIVATVNFIGYTCYNGAPVADTLRAPPAGPNPGYLNYWFNDPIVEDATGLLNTTGFAPLPQAWRNAILNTFVKPNASTAPLNLFISTAGSGSANSACVGVFPGA